MWLGVLDAAEKGLVGDRGNRSSVFSRSASVDDSKQCKARAPGSRSAVNSLGRS